MTSPWNKMSASSQTDIPNADTPGHELHDASGHISQPVQPVTVPHARQVVSPEWLATEGEYGQDVCVCITCHMRCPNNATLRKHGKEEDHHTYGCVCGSTFSRLDVLRRHITSKNNVTDFFCPLCEHDEAPRAFSRPDHLPQHLRTFHRIPAGRIPEDFSANSSHDCSVDDSMTPHQSTRRYPCLVLGCMRTGELAYLQQIDLDEHMALVHSTPQNITLATQGLNDLIPAPTWTNDSFQPNAYLQPFQMFGQYAQQNGFLRSIQSSGPYAHHNSLLQSGPGESFQGDGGFPGNTFTSSPNLQWDDNFNIDFEMDFSHNA